MLYHHILSVERKPLTTKGYPILLQCKTFQQLHLIIPRESDCLDVMETIKSFSQPGQPCPCLSSENEDLVVLSERESPLKNNLMSYLLKTVVISQKEL